MALGKSAAKFRLEAFAVGGALMGLAGAAQAHFIGFIAPDDYRPTLTFQVWAMLIVGGSGNNRGAILGAVIVWGVWAISASVIAALFPPAEQARAASLQIVLIGVALCAILLLRPRGDSGRGQSHIAPSSPASRRSARHPPFSKSNARPTMPKIPDRIRLGDNLDISRLVCGLWQVADLERNGATLDPGRAADALEAYARAGFDTFDMADHYGSAEAIAGRLLARYPRQGRPLAFTKWCPPPGPMTSDIVGRGVEERLRQLNVDQVDLLQLHWWRFEHPAWLDALHEMNRLRDEGAIGEIGVTNFDARRILLWRLPTVRPSSAIRCPSL